MFHEYLDNGLEVVLKENHFSQTVAIQCWVNVGSIHEGPAERGMAHFLEHMLFKGTGRRQVGEIAATVEANGGEINAYTTFDHTVYHITMASPQSAVAVDLLADAIASSAIDPDEFEREREVILEEIRRSQDSPASKVGRRVFELRYAGTEAGRPIIGSMESVGGFKRDDLFNFYKKWYQPKNMTVVIVGDFDTEAMLGLVKEHFGTMKNTVGLKLETPKQEPVPVTALTPPHVSVLRGDYKQPRLEVVWPVPSFEHPDAAALDLAAFALGSGEMSRLSRRLRDEEGIVTAVGASTYLPRFGGVFELSAFMGEDDLAAVAQSLAREVALLRTAEPVTADELQRARANLRSDRIARDETVDGQARSLGFSMRTAQKLLFEEVYTTLINAMPDSSLKHAIERWLRPEAAMLVALVPAAHPLTEDALANAYRAGVAEAQELAAKVARTGGAAFAGAGKSTREAVKDQLFDVAPGIKLVHRQNPAAQLFTVTAATEGGLRAEEAHEAGIQHAMAGLLCMETTEHSYEELMSAVEGMGASLEGFSGKDSMGIHLQCLTEHLVPMLSLFRACFLSPVFPEVQWLNLKREIEQAIASQNDSPASIAMRNFQEQMYGQHPYRYPLYGTADAVATFNESMLLERFRKFRDAGPWVISVTSSLEGAHVAEMLHGVLAGFHPQSETRRFAADDLLRAPHRASMRLPKEREQSHIVYGFRGLDWGDKERPALDVLVNILGGNGGRLFMELRDKNSLAYSVSPLITYGQHPGVVASYIACAPSKEKAALAALKTEMLRLTKELPEADELARSKAYIVGTHDMNLQRSDAQTSTMALMQAYGHGYDDFLTYPERIEKVTADEVRAVAQRLFDETAALDVTVGPGA